MKVYTILNIVIGILSIFAYFSILVIGSLFGYSDDLDFYMRITITAILSNLVVFIYYLIRDKSTYKKSLKICVVCMAIQLLLPLPFWGIAMILLQ